MYNPFVEFATFSSIKEKTMSVKIIIDSTTDISPALRSRCAVVPLSVRFGDMEYIDGVTIDHVTFYEKLLESKELPTTSQPTPDAFSKAYAEALAEHDEVLVLTLSSVLSGTYQSATIAAMDYPGKVTVVDTRNVSIGAGILTELALNMAHQGKNAQEIAENITIMREKVAIFAIVDTLEYLKKGGRISKTVAFAGELLSVKPLICIADGEIKMVGKARGIKQANALLNKLFLEAGDVDHTKPILLGYTGLSDIPVKKYAQESDGLWESYQDRTCPIGCTIGTHGGPGAYAAACFIK
jgi:DegV family protein with EDD domain